MTYTVTFCKERIEFSSERVYGGDANTQYVTAPQVNSGYWICGEGEYDDGRAGGYIILCDKCARKSGLKW